MNSNRKDYPLSILEPLRAYFTPSKVTILASERHCLVAVEDGNIVGTDGCLGASSQVSSTAIPSRSSSGLPCACNLPRYRSSLLLIEAACTRGHRLPCGKNCGMGSLALSCEEDILPVPPTPTNTCEPITRKKRWRASRDWKV